MNRLYNIYDVTIKDGTITTKKLKEFGMTSNDINKLLETKLKRVKRGYYSVKNVNNLFFYGKKLLNDEKYEEAKCCFEMCTLIDPNFLRASFRLFYYYIKNEDYENALIYLKKISVSENKNYEKEYNIYLMLLNELTNLPLEFVQRIENMKREDVQVLESDKRYENKKLRNKIREDIYDGHYSHALFETKRIKDVKVSDSLQRFLLMQVLNKKYSEIDSLINEGRYEEAKMYLMNFNLQNNLKEDYEYIFKLISVYLKIKETKNVPYPLDLECNDVFEAIDSNKFSLALKLNSKNNVLNKVLLDICNLINEVNEDKKVKEEIEAEEKERKYLEKRHEELSIDNPVIVLKKMSNDRIEVLKRIIISSYTDMYYFTIGTINNRQLVLKYNPYEKIGDIQEEVNKAKNLYNEENYEKATKQYKNLILYFHKPSYFLFLRLGLCYYKLKDKTNALKYIKIADSIELKNGYDGFEELIKRIKREDISDYKPHLRIEDDEFSKDNISNNYGIDEDIINYIIESGLDVTTACKEMNYTDEEINIIKLFFAAKYYSQGSIKTADLFFKSYEKSENKTEKDKIIYNEIMKNKKLYTRRNNGNSVIKYTLKP